MSDKSSAQRRKLEDLDAQGQDVRSKRLKLSSQYRSCSPPRTESISSLKSEPNQNNDHNNNVESCASTIENTPEAESETPREEDSTHDNYIVGVDRNYYLLGLQDTQKLYPLHSSAPELLLATGKLVDVGSVTKVLVEKNSQYSFSK